MLSLAYAFTSLSSSAVVVVDALHRKIFTTPTIAAPSLPTSTQRYGVLRLHETISNPHHNPFNDRIHLSAGSLLSYDTLLVPSSDQPLHYYGLLATDISINNQVLTVRLNTQAYFTNRSPVSSRDVIESLRTLIQQGPLRWQQLQHWQLRFTQHDNTTFSIEANKPISYDLLTTLGSAPIAHADSLLSNHPIGSGPYINNRNTNAVMHSWTFFDQYWAKDHQVIHGRYNFNTIEYYYYQHRYSALQGFKNHQYDIRREYYFENWLSLLQSSKKNPSLSLVTPSNPRSTTMHGYIFNFKKPMWHDPHLRKAIALIFPFAKMNQGMFNNDYQQILSYFSGFLPHRSSLLQSSDTLQDTIESLLSKAGYIMKNGVRVHAKSNVPLKLHLVVFNKEHERVAQVFTTVAKTYAIEISVRLVDSSRYYTFLSQNQFDLAYWQFTSSMHPLTYLRINFLQPSQQRTFSNVSGYYDENLLSYYRQIEMSSPSLLPSVLQKLDNYLIQQQLIIPFWTPKHDRIAKWQGLCCSSQPSLLKTFYHWWHCDED